MARKNNSFYEQFLNELAAQMQQMPSPKDNPELARLMGARTRSNQMDRVRPPGGHDLLGALGAMVDPRPFVSGAKWSFTHPIQRLTDPEMNNRLEFPGVKGPLGAAEHGAAVRSELLAKRAAKGPRKPGGGRRAKPKPVQTPPTPPQDLLKALAESVPAAEKPIARGAIKSLLFRLGRNR